MSETIHDEARRFRPNENIRPMDILACPNMIKDPEHYHKGKSCRCFNKDASEMEKAGYFWDSIVWVVPLIRPPRPSN